MTKCEITITRIDGTLRLTLAGDWKLANGLPSVAGVLDELGRGEKAQLVGFDTDKLAGWDSGLLTFLVKILEQCAARTITVDQGGLPEGVRRILALATAVPERKGARRSSLRAPFLERVGGVTIELWRSQVDLLTFIGEAFVSLARVMTGKARFRRSDLLVILQDVGAQAVPIVSLISFLVGLILAFVGAIQLVMFGAQIYVANLVGIAMVREMGAIMTGIIMAGRTGAAFAAQLGTMQVNEEIDALQTLGIPAMDFLVLPRMIALFLMMPLLCLYADLMGVLGGFVVGVTMLDLNPMEYLIQTKGAVRMADFWVGIFMSAVFGILVAMSGCLQGIRCGRSASSVGNATTSAVVNGIISIIIATAIITVICNVLGI